MLQTPFDSLSPPGAFGFGPFICEQLQSASPSLWLYLLKLGAGVARRTSAAAGALGTALGVLRHRVVRMVGRTLRRPTPEISVLRSLGRLLNLFGTESVGLHACLSRPESKLVSSEVSKTRVPSESTRTVQRLESVLSHPGSCLALGSLLRYSPLASANGLTPFESDCCSDVHGLLLCKIRRVYTP